MVFLITRSVKGKQEKKRGEKCVEFSWDGDPNYCRGSRA
jgi:hypothetical protein